MLGKRFRLFKIFGFEIRVDASWIFLAILITWSLAQGMFPYSYPDLSKATYWWMGVIGALGLFASIVIHELSHSLVARHYGLPMSGITLFIFGGVAEMTDEPARPGVEFQMAVVGPIMSVVLGLIFLGLTSLGQSGGWGGPTLGILGYLSTINFVLAAFNIIPAFPLDGGRVLRAALWRWKKNLERATKTASQIGSGFGFLLLGLAILAFIRGNFFGGMWWFLIGLFLRDAARSSYQQVLVQGALRGESVGRFMIRDPVMLPGSTSLQDFVDHYVLRYHYKMFPVGTDGERLLGCASVSDLKKFPRTEWERHSVEEITHPCERENTVEENTPAEEALKLMGRSGNTRLLVAQRGRLMGVVTLKDLLRFISTKLDLDEEFREVA